MNEGERVAVLAFGGDDEREICAESFCAEGGTVAKAYFAEDNGKSETLLGMIVGGFHAVDVEEGEDAFCVTVRIDESLPGVIGVKPKDDI